MGLVLSLLYQLWSFLVDDRPADRILTYQEDDRHGHWTFNGTDQHEYQGHSGNESYLSWNKSPRSSTAYCRDQSHVSAVRSSNRISVQDCMDKYLRPLDGNDLRGAKVQVDVTRDSCRTATILWSSVRDSHVDITITKVSGYSDVGTPQRYRHLARERKFCIPTELVQGKEYKVVVRGVTSHAQGVTTFRTVFTSLELQTLHDMAIRHVERGGGKRFQRCDVFYRNKPFAYFKECERNNNVMTPYMKDNNGDPASIINGQIKGLFFATSVDPQTGRPPHWSFFGPKRISIPATAMLTKNSNLYFADFYCNNKAHYVTVVLTRPGSKTDRFCEKNLIELDTGHNDFLWRNNQVYCSRKVWVEVLYTENIQLSNPLITFSIVEGRGTSKPGGLPKNPSCVKCNLPTPATTTRPTVRGVSYSFWGDL